MIKVRVIDAEYKKDSDTFSKMDPYAIFQCNGRKFQTKTCRDGGIHPKFNQEFGINTNHMKNPTLVIKTFDDDPVKDDPIGEGEVNLEHWMTKPNQNSMYEIGLNTKGKIVGVLRVQFFYDPHLVIL